MKLKETPGWLGVLLIWILVACIWGITMCAHQKHRKLKELCNMGYDGVIKCPAGTVDDGTEGP